MRRPLLFVCICLFAGIALWMKFFNPLSAIGDETGWQGETVLLVGQVYDKEIRMDAGEETLILYLKSIYYSTEADASYLQIKQASKKLSDILSADNLICEVKRNGLPQGAFVPSLGSEVFLKGRWESIRHATNPGEFDAASYYWTEGIGARVTNVELLGMGQEYWRIKEGLFRLREKLLQNLYLGFSKEVASILAKMLLGVGSELDEEIRDLYQDNGIVHILSISGLHITLLGMGLYKLLRQLTCPMIMSAVAGGAFILSYGCMTGFSISAYRAVGMYLIHMLGEIWGKTYDMLTAMGVLAMIMVAGNPWLVYHTGFLLSFSSVCGVGLLTGLLQFTPKWLKKQAGERKVLSYGKSFLQKTADGFSVSMAVTLFTLPLQLFFFYKIPVYSVLINLLVIPVMGIVMGIGIIVMLIPQLVFLGAVEALFFQWFEFLCRGFETLPGHTLVTGRPVMWKILVYYVVLLGMILAGKRIQGSKRFVCFMVMVCFLVWRPQTEAKITMLDVGQGECICVQSGTGQCFLFDGGSSSRQNIGEKVIIPFLLYEGIERIDAIFLSHGDTDHYSGITELLEQEEIAVGALYLPDVGDAADKDFEAIRKAAGKVPIQYVSVGDRWERGDMQLICLHPPAGIETDSNAYSACYLWQKGNFRMLFTGDIEARGEERLLTEMGSRGIDAVDVLKIAHHGSRNATSEEFLKRLDIKLAVISCGRSNSYGHPHADTLDRLYQEGCNIMVTAECGAIMIEEEAEMRAYGFIEK